MKEMICEKCRRLIVEDVCPICGCTDVHEPAENDHAFLITADHAGSVMVSKILEQKDIPYKDHAFLITADHAGSVMVSKILEQKDIPYKMATVQIGKYSVTRDFYVPYGRLEEAELELDNFSVNKQPTEDFLSEGLGQDVFHAEEIDQMEWADLDDMELEELKAYKDKMVKTLKEIKAQEQQWKTRVTKLLDMKEEAEGLIEDLE